MSAYLDCYRFIQIKAVMKQRRGTWCSAADASACVSIAQAKVSHAFDLWTIGEFRQLLQARHKVTAAMPATVRVLHRIERRSIERGDDGDGKQLRHIIEAIHGKVRTKAAEKSGYAAEEAGRNRNKLFRNKQIIFQNCLKLPTCNPSNDVQCCLLPGYGDALTLEFTMSIEVLGIPWTPRHEFALKSVPLESIQIAEAKMQDLHDELRQTRFMLNDTTDRLLCLQPLFLECDTSSTDTTVEVVPFQLSKLLYKAGDCCFSSQDTTKSQRSLIESAILKTF